MASSTFSIIVPVGPGRTALPALESLTTAGLQGGDEVLIVGDGQEVPIPPRFRDLPLRGLSTTTRQGANAARNLGAHNARNPILCFLDDDDRYSPDSLSEIAAYISEASACGAWALGWRFLSGKKQYFTNYPKRITEPTIWKRNLAGGCSSMIVRKAVFEEAGGFDPAMPAMQDWDLWLRLSRITVINRVPKAFVLYDDQPGTRISTNQHARLRGLEQLLKKNFSHWPAGVRAFHQARIASIRHALGEVGWPAIFQRADPVGSFYFMVFKPF